MILTSDKIADLLEAGTRPGARDPLRIIPTPELHSLRKSRSASIDLRLGTWFDHSKQAQIGHLSVLEEDKSLALTTTSYVRFGKTYFLHPQSFVLAATLEWISLPTNMAAYVVGKSSWGRHGLIIATAIGVHPGYKGCLTLELSNIGEVPIDVTPGVRICQLFIHQVDGSAAAIPAQLSSFAALRRPHLKTIHLDSVAKKLKEAYENRTQK